MKNILDVSSIVYGAGSENRKYGFPISGIRKVLGIINSGIKTNDFIICFDGGSTLKKELLPTYKAGRVPDYSVIAQIDLLRQILDECNIPYYYKPGYEADDFIYSFCYFMQCIRNSDPTVIRTDDRDMACCITSNISMAPATSNGKLINKDSFQYQVVNGKKIPWNTIMLYKIFHGDTSDNYSGIKIPGMSFNYVAESAVNQIEPLIEQGYPEIMFSDKDILTALLLADEFNLDDEQVELIKKQIEIVVPRRVEVADCSLQEYVAELARKPAYEVEKHLKICTRINTNISKLSWYCSCLGIKSRGFDTETPEVQAFYELLANQAKDLSQGVFAIERYNRKHEYANATNVELENMSLPI